MLETVDVTGAAPKLLAELKLPEGYGHQLLLYHGRLLVALTDREGNTQLALRRRDRPREAGAGEDPRRQRLPGRRAPHGGRPCASCSASPRARSASPASPSPPSRGRDRAWVPRGTLPQRAASTRSARRRSSAARGSAGRASFAGLEELTVLTIDIDKGLDPVDADAVMTGGGTVYALGEEPVRGHPALLAGGRGADQRARARGHDRRRSTASRSTTPTTRPTAAAASIPGYVLNQFSHVRAGRRAARRQHRRPAVVQRTRRPATAWSRRWPRAGRAPPARPGRRPRQGRAHLRRALLRRRRLRGHLPADRPAVHGRPLRPRPPARARRAGDPGRLVLPAPDRGRPPDRRRHRPERRRRAVRPAAVRVRRLRPRHTPGSSSASPSTAATARWPTTTTPSSGGSRATWPSCRCRSTATSRPSATRTSPAPPTPCRRRSSPARSGGRSRPGAIAEAGRAEHAEAVVRRSIVMGDRLLTMSDAGLQANALDG